MSKIKVEIEFDVVEIYQGVPIVKTFDRWFDAIIGGKFLSVGSSLVDQLQGWHSILDLKHAIGKLNEACVKLKANAEETPQPKRFEVGQVWKNRFGEGRAIQSVDDPTNKGYPIRSEYGWYDIDGKSIYNEELDLVTLVQDVEEG